MSKKKIEIFASSENVEEVIEEVIQTDEVIVPTPPAIPPVCSHPKQPYSVQRRKDLPFEPSCIGCVGGNYHALKVL